MIVFNEDTRVKIPATIQFLKIGYKYQSMRKADIDYNTKIFVNRFKPSLEKINGRKISYDEIKEILMDIDNVIKNHDLGKEFYNWLINPLDRVKLIDFDNIDNNDFAIVDELPFTIVEGSEEGSFRPDINILVNGIPLAFLEVKRPNNQGGIQEEFKRMINKRLQNRDYVKFFNLIQMVSFSNNMEYEEGDDAEDVKAGSFYTTPNGKNTSFSFFREDNLNYIEDYDYHEISENKIKEIVRDLGYKSTEADTPEFKENMKSTTPCNSFVTSVFDKERFLYFLKYGIMFIDEQIHQKHIMRYPQFFATRKIIERLESGGKGGIIWHTQGSGKTALAAFANRVIRDYYSKKNINTRFFFVVDRLELLRQASVEFKNRGLNVVNCNSRAEFTKELNKSLSTNIDSKAIGEVCVVNIQKFEESLPEARNDYDVNIQRVFFIDEAHRSYKLTGEFFKNLMTCDREAVYIALTGTPLLTKKERSNLKFGDYIHKYFYDKSIADGYTLKIKKENIDTVAKKDILNNLQIEETQIDDKTIFESDEYIKDLGVFIERDFKNFRLFNGDNTLGGMIVCRTNNQAKKMQEWFETNSKIKTGLVISDSDNPVQSQINKNNQINFRESNAPDMLIVNLMLTTGYDVKRLKKMYLLRGPHAQSLLQTISRVNRPYKSKNGKVYKYGYIVDFVDITNEYDRTVDAYVKELEDDINQPGEEIASLDGLVIDKEDINNKYREYKNNIEKIVSTENIQLFANEINGFEKDVLHKIRRSLQGIKECYTEFVLSNAVEYIKQIDIEKIKVLIRTVQERIDFINLNNNPVEIFDATSNQDIVKILYEFIKTKISILNLGDIGRYDESVKDFTDTVTEVQKEIKKNKNKDDIKIVMLDELLQKIFNKLEIIDLDKLDDLTEELREALCKARDINYENDRLARNYGGNFGFVKTYQDSISIYEDVDKKTIERMLVIAYEKIKDNIDNDVLLIQGRDNFIASIKKKITVPLVKEKIYSVIKKFYDNILSELYTNIQLFK